jgi:hypothetical protein
MGANLTNMAKQHKTNEQRLIALVKDNHPILNALLVERILFIAELTHKQAIENPEAFTIGGLIHPRLYTELYEQVEKHLKGE